MAPNVIKELQSKIAALERNNKVLNERLGRTEHKVGVLLQWALSFPGLAASQGLTQVKPPTIRTPPKPTPTIGRRSVGRAKTTTKSQPKSKRRKKDEIKETVEVLPEDPKPSSSGSQIMHLSDTFPSDDISQNFSLTSIDTSKAETQVIEVSVDKATSGDFLVMEELLPLVEVVSEQGGQSETYEQMEQGVENLVEDKDKVVEIEQLKFVCSICGSGYAYQHGLNRHMNTAHERIQEFHCKLCGKIFYRQDKLRSHEVLCAKKATIT